MRPIEKGLGLLPLPQESVSVPLSKHIYLLVFTGRQELSLCQYFELQLGNILDGKLECLWEILPPPSPYSRLSPGSYSCNQLYWQVH